jgi:hypothetical protein
LLLVVEMVVLAEKAVLAWRVVLAVRLLELQIFYLMDSLERLTEITTLLVQGLRLAVLVALLLLEQAEEMAEPLVEQS